MIDSGATSNFMSLDFASKHHIPLLQKDKPEVLTVIDGTPISSGAITSHTSEAILSYADDHCEGVSFNIIPMPKYHLILGTPWLAKHSPNLDWKNQAIQFTSSYCQQHCKLQSQAINISTVSSSEFNSLMADPFNIAFGSISPSPATSIPELSCFGTSQPTSIPPPYQDFADLFDKSAADVLPHHKPYDHKIPLVPNATPPHGPIYGLSEPELRALREYLSENLARGFI